jgi:hypothetical protein
MGDPQGRCNRPPDPDLTIYPNGYVNTVYTEDEVDLIAAYCADPEAC